MKTRARLSKPSTIAMWAAAIAILGVFVFPLWKISLHAPQYPQGLGIDIWIHRIEGATPHDLQNINGLNHYIGMQAIVPDSIPELRYMKFFAAGLAALAAAVALVRRRWALLAWTLLALVLAGAGMYDFYKWEYAYGHNLNPDAAIKIPGMSYQPPLLGTKQLLNFTTTAYPGVGGLLAMLGVGLGALALMYEFVWARMFRCECSTRVVEKAGARAAAIVASIALMAFMVGCAREPQTISYGTDACEFCSMTISDDRYGAAIVTSKGRTHKFDSVECMLQSVMEGEKLAGTTVHAWYATSYPERGVLVDATAIAFLVSPNLPSPMGAGVTAFAARTDAERMQMEKGGEVMDWAGVENFIRSWSKS
jgi:copper chaperone NosL